MPRTQSGFASCFPPVYEDKPKVGYDFFFLGGGEPTNTLRQELKSKNHLKLYFDLQQGTLHADAKLFAAQQVCLIIQ